MQPSLDISQKNIIAIVNQRIENLALTAEGYCAPITLLICRDLLQIISVNKPTETATDSKESDSNQLIELPIIEKLRQVVNGKLTDEELRDFINQLKQLMHPEEFAEHSHPQADSKSSHQAHEQTHQWSYLELLKNLLPEQYSPEIAVSEKRAGLLTSPMIEEYIENKLAEQTLLLIGGPTHITVIL